ncbi:uncharacterized protein PV09_07962 [Verruconis gallopava]|uniref:RING-type domain-containing protein n=1 Tax=Verruconis gallopava TaxID=253628 RepID=A0A0D2A194_9PEZI|nr:uncharacterized protein PV09_07962 [Verruconis gallopava]KIW00433.1 hypothetical protein PV09_07962 [Verruconis gallopava]
MRNLTLGIAPSLDDLILLPHRAAERAKQFAYYYGLDDIFGRIKGSGAFIAENTGNASNVSASLTKEALAKNTIAEAALSATNVAKASPGPRVAAVATGTGLGGAFSQGLNETGVSRFVNALWHAWRNLGGILPYVMSKWAFMTVLMSFVVNRTQFYASSRVPLHLWWPVRFGLFLAPIAAVCIQVLWLLEGMRCQTSPDYAIYRYGNASKVFDLDYGGEGGFIYALSSSLTAWETDFDACVNVGMSNADGVKPVGSLSLLWPLFLSLCLGAFTDTLSSALQGRPPLSDYNLLELSFAFNEAEAMVVRIFEAALAASEDHDVNNFDRKLLVRATNTSPDMLLIAAIWGLSSLTSMLLGIFGKRHQYRLLNTGFWGIAYFAALSRSIVLMWLRMPEQEAFWSGRIPMILLMGFVPHFIVVTGMVTCALIYGAALITTALSLPPAAGRPASFREALSIAYSNLQANVHFSNVSSFGFRMTDDFYTALLNTGFTLLTAASEAVYLNEGAKVHVSQLTWLERKRIKELQQGLLFKRTRQAIPTELRAAINDRVEAAMGNPQPSGYSVERKIRGQDREEVLAVVKGNASLPVERGSRYNMALRLIIGTFWLVAGFNAKLIIMSLELLGITWRPRILRRLMGTPKHRHNAEDPMRNRQGRRIDLLVFPDDEIVQVGGNPNIDIEAEFKKHSVPDADVDDSMYTWWRQGGYWGEIDTSGEYTPSQMDDDATSMISMSTECASTDGDEWSDIDDSGRRTPTQRNPYPSSREATPIEYDGAFDSEQLARLLDPRNKDEQEEARILARRLRHRGIMTRSQYNREMMKERAALLASSRYGQHVAISPNGGLLSPEEEEAALEKFILERRSQNMRKRDSNEEDWASGAAGMGASGPQCVVCQDNPRTILLWPCGCLCLCDDCRVNMAARNFGSCICCRTGTMAYSRLYVP